LFFLVEELSHKSAAPTFSVFWLWSGGGDRKEEEVGGGGGGRKKI